MYNNYFTLFFSSFTHMVKPLPMIHFVLCPSDELQQQADVA